MNYELMEAALLAIASLVPLGMVVIGFSEDRASKKQCKDALERHEKHRKQFGEP